MMRDRETAEEPGRVGEDGAAASPADQPSPAVPDRAVGFSLETEAIASAVKRLNGLFDLLPVIDQINDASTDTALALEERRWNEFTVSASKLSSLANHLVRAIEQRRPRKRSKN